MELKVTAFNGGSSGASVNLSEAVFQKDFNEALIHQVVVAYMAAGRAGTRAHKTRAQVSGGGAKPFRQKGTGRARAGTIRSPLWRGGGKTFASVPQDYSQKVNRKMYRGAMRSILSELARQDRLVVVDDVKMEGARTKDLCQKLKAMGVEKALIVSAEFEENLHLSSRNLIHVQALDVNRVDPVSLVAFEKVIMTVDAIKKFEEMLG